MIVPMNLGTTLFVEYDFMDQNRNWSGTSSAPASANDDKDIRTHFMTAGGQYRFDDKWAVSVDVPVWNRSFTTDSGAGLDTFNHTALGDVRVTGVYSGLSDDMSTSLLIGVKLPTGDFRYAGFDRDTEIGGGSSDLLLGLAHAGALTGDGAWTWYGQIIWDKPLLSQGGYMPGSDVNAALGIAYGDLPASGGVQITPFLQMIGSNRIKDGGVNANRPNSGYSRVLLSPGIEIAAGKWKAYGDVEFPVYQDVNGNQLTAQRLFKFAVSYSLDG